MKYDVAIIGGGPAGYTAAERAAQGGLSTILFEKNALGGVCLNEGCVPTKTLLYSAKTYDNIKHASKYAVKAENPSFDLPKIIARKNKVVKKLTAGIRMKMTEHGVVMVTAEACIQGRAADGTITIAAGEELYEAANLLICTGSETVIPPIPGLAETEYWTSREALQSKELPASLVIIGGGVIGMEFASFFNSLGVEVHVVEMLDKILGPMDRELSEMLQAEYTKRGIKFYLSHKVTGVHGTEVSVEKDGETFTLHGDKVLLSVGRRPVTKGFGLETLAPEPFRNGVKVNEYMQTSLPNVYACGDITAFSLLAHTAVSEVEVAVDCLVPGIGEIIGGSQREDDYDKLLARIQELGLKEEDYKFYLDLRKYGSARHAGFGLGFERCVMYLTGMANIRDVIPFPRTVNNCEL